MRSHRRSRARTCPLRRGSRPARCLLLVLAVLAGWTVAATAGAAPPPFDAERARLAREGIDERRAELRERLGELRAERDAAPVDGQLQEDLDEEIAVVERLDRLQADLTVAILRAGELSAVLEKSEQKLAAGPRGQVPADPPYDLVLFDTLWDALHAQRDRLAELERTTASAADQLEDARKRFDRRERARREAVESLARSEDAPEVERARLRRRLRLAELESQLAEGRRELGELSLENAERALEIQRLSESLISHTVDWVEERLSVSEDDLRAPLEAIAAARFEAARAQDFARRELEVSERRLRQSERQLDARGGADPEAAAELAARQRAQILALRRLDFLEARNERLDRAEAWWSRRVRVLSEDVERAELRDWIDELDDIVAERASRLKFEAARLEEHRQEASRLRVRSDAASSRGDSTRRWLENQLAQQDALVRLIAEEVESSRQHVRLLERTRDEMGRRIQTLSVAERVEEAADWVEDAWNTELTSVDDRPITIGKIATALVLLVLGLTVSRRLSAFIGRALTRRASFGPGAAAAFQSLIFYALLLGFLLLALDTASIPLTVFTFVGGALAIGIGFGSQNIVNNFISGLILLVERPIKVGDLVQVEGTHGSIQSIGARSTVVRTFDNINIIVPNSTFLETNVVNWTLSDQTVRTRVAVGVAYGSPVREVERVLLEAMKDAPAILDQPEPVVRFRDFGDNALAFEALFWLRLGPTADRIKVESDLRFEIDRAFAERGIEIAFPQRDLHIRSGDALRVRIESPDS